MSTRSPYRVDQLCFLLRREPTVRTTRNLERRSSPSLSKTSKTNLLPLFALLHVFCFQKWRRRLFSFCLILIKHFHNSQCVPFVLIFNTWHYLGNSSHPLTNHATCVIWVHVVGDFCHITYISRAFLRHPTLGALKNVKFQLSQNSTKFDVVARFREMILTVKSVSSSKI